MSKVLIVSIHQPNFFPWLGYFNKIARSDLFIFLDHVANNPKSPIYSKRVQILMNGKPYWLLIPLKKDSERTFVPINEMRYADITMAGKKHVKTIMQAYSKFPYFNLVFPLIEEYYLNTNNSLSTNNICFIKKLMIELNLKTQTVLSSSLNHINSSNELLIELLHQVKGSTYLCGDGSNGYQNDMLFNDAGVNVQYQNFKHPVYGQKGSVDFFPGLSIIDCLMNHGFEATSKMIKPLL
tara:strand:+ start:6578 stop:7291 length:714 start_codon:yes stop_codon:yes gene_type:complete